MEHFPVIALLGALLACGGAAQDQEAQAPEPVDDSVTAPSGGAGFVVECVSPAQCVEQAASRCPSGYDLRPLGESGRTVAATESSSGAVALDVFGTPVAFAASESQTTWETARSFMVECTTRPHGGLESPCDTADNCASLRVGFRRAELPTSAVQCAPSLDGQKRCSFDCNVEGDIATSGRLVQLCEETLRRKCIATGADDNATTCQREE